MDKHLDLQQDIEKIKYEINEYEKTVDENKFLYIDLCSGMGGFHQAMENIKEIDSQVLFAADIEKNCREVYKKNYGVEPYNDLTKINVLNHKKFNGIFAGFPCFVKNTKVLTNNGYKNIQNVKLEDKLLTHVGKFQKILNLQRKTYNDNLYNIKISYAPHELKVTKEHPFYVNRNGIIDWIETKYLEINDYVGLPINKKSIIPNSSKINISLDNFILHDKIIPEWLHDAPIDFIKNFIKDYNNKKNITTTSYNLAFGIQRLLLKIGIISSIKYNKTTDKTIIEGREVNQRNFYTITWGNKNLKGYIQDNYMWRKITEINKYKTLELVYNFEVENDNSYCVENTIVHNCQPFSVSGKRMGLDDARGTIIHYILNMVKQRKPELICLENVKGLKSLKNKDQNGEEVICYKLIYTVLKDLGYYITDRVISPHEINIPQKRERVVIICCKKDLVKNENIKSNENFSKIVLNNVEKLIIERKEKHKNINIFDDIKDVKPKYKLNCKLEDFKIDNLNENELNKLKKKIEGLNKKNKSLDLWEKIINDKEWDSLDNKQLQKDFIKNTNIKKCSKNFKQEHIFIDFLYYKNTTLIPDKLKTKNRKKNNISNQFKKISDMWNKLYNNSPEFKKLWDKIINKYHDDFLYLPLQYKYLEYSGGEDYGSNNSLNNKYCQFRMSGVRIRKGGIFPTLVKSGPMPIFIKERRYLTDKEGLRLQSFKDTFEFVGPDSSVMRRLGNAVNTEVIEIMLRCGLEQIFPNKFNKKEIEEKNNCNFILTRGKNKGKKCGKKNCKSKLHNK